MSSHKLFDSWLLIGPTRLVLDFVEEPTLLIKLEVRFRAPISIAFFNVLSFCCVDFVQVDAREERLHVVPSLLGSCTAIVIANTHYLGPCGRYSIVELLYALELVDFVVF